MFPHSLKELAVSVLGPRTSPRQMEGAELGGRGHPCPAIRRTASLYIIYICMYCSRFCTDHALCQVVPIKAAPRALLPGFLIHWGGEWAGIKDARLPQWSPPTSAASNPEELPIVSPPPYPVPANCFSAPIPPSSTYAFCPVLLGRAEGF